MVGTSLADVIKRPSEVRRYLENENMPVGEAPDDEGDGAPRQSYNFAPGYHGIVYRANVPDWGAGSRHLREGVDEDEKRSATEPEATEPDVTEQEEQTNEAVQYKLQSMKWGLIPFWTKRNPDYGSMMKTINCRDDSLVEKIPRTHDETDESANITSATDIDVPRKKSCHICTCRYGIGCDIGTELSESKGSCNEKYAGAICRPSFG